MANTKYLLVAILALAAILAAQTPLGRTVVLAWDDDRNPAGTSYTIYRATGLCSGTPAFSVIANGITERTYEDQGVMPGNYCYTVTALYAGMESAQSNAAPAAALPWEVQRVSATVR